MGYVAKVEAAVFKATRAKRLNKAKDKGTVPPKTAKAGTTKVSFSELTQTRQLIPTIQQALIPTDPFDFKNETWIEFIKQVTPKLMTALLVDMKIIPKNKKNLLLRYLTQRLRILNK